MYIIIFYLYIVFLSLCNTYSYWIGSAVIERAIERRKNDILLLAFSMFDFIYIYLYIYIYIYIYIYVYVDIFKGSTSMFGIICILEYVSHMYC